MALDPEPTRARLPGAHRCDPARLNAWIRRLAHPRQTGSEGAARAWATIRAAFEELGFEATELPFTFSTWPGRFGLPVAGLVLAVTAASAAALLWTGHPATALGVLVVGLGLALAPLAGLGTALRRVPWGRIETANVLFTRPGQIPSWLVMAHMDTKSQGVPTLVRTVALAAGVGAWAVLLGLTAWALGGGEAYPAAVLGGGGAAVVAGLVLGGAWTGNASPGALDNATGLAALLAVAEAGPVDVGFLVTDGEELGLAGSRAVVDRLPAVRGAVNLDGLDDVGRIRLTEGHGPGRRGTAPALATALETAGRALEIDVDRRPLPRSILVDHQPLAAAGIPALTVLRGDWRSLLRVHRPADSADRLDGRGAAECATLLLAALTLLHTGRKPHIAAGILADT